MLQWNSCPLKISVCNTIRKHWSRGRVALPVITLKSIYLYVYHVNKQSSQITNDSYLDFNILQDVPGVLSTPSALAFMSICAHMLTHATPRLLLWLTLQRSLVVVFFYLYSHSPPKERERPWLHLQSCSHTRTYFLLSYLNLLQTALPTDFSLSLADSFLDKHKH